MGCKLAAEVRWTDVSLGWGDTFKLEPPNRAEKETRCNALADGCICGADRRNHVVVAWYPGTTQEGDKGEQRRGI